jgi:glutathione S-transferase
VFAAYAAAAAVLIFKGVGMSWLTIVRMIQVNGGFRSPEDIRKTPMNPKPDAGQLQPNERVERARRIQQNDLESLPYFLVAGLLYVLTGPPLLLARCLLWGFVAFRLLHFAAYYTGRSHDVRAMLWTPGSLILVFMTACVLIAAFQG